MAKAGDAALQALSSHCGCLKKLPLGTAHVTSDCLKQAEFCRGAAVEHVLALGGGRWLPDSCMWSCMAEWFHWRRPASFMCSACLLHMCELQHVEVHVPGLGQAMRVLALIFC